jgi:hypothetical protein
LLSPTTIPSRRIFLMLFGCVMVSSAVRSDRRCLIPWTPR